MNFWTWFGIVVGGLVALYLLGGIVFTVVCILHTKFVTDRKRGTKTKITFKDIVVSIIGWLPFLILSRFVK